MALFLHIVHDIMLSYPARTRMTRIGLVSILSARTRIDYVYRTGIY